MASKKELRKMTQAEKAIINTRGEALLTMGVIVIGLSMLMAIVEIARGSGAKAFGFLIFAFGYLGGAAIFSYKYQKTKGFLLLGIFGILLTIGAFILYVIGK